MRLLSIFLTITIGSIFALCSCSDSSNTNDPNKPGDSSTTTGTDSSYGDAYVRIDQHTKFTATDNFYCYDRRDSTFRILVKHSDYTLIFTMQLPELKAGFFLLGRGQGSVTVKGPSNATGGPIDYGDSVMLTILKMDPSQHRFSAIVSVRFHEPFGGLNSIDTIRIDDGGFVEYPFKRLPTFSATIDGAMYPGTNASVLISQVTWVAVEDWAVYRTVGSVSSGEMRSLSVDIMPTPEKVGTYTIPGRGNFSYAEYTYDKSGAPIADSNYYSIDGTITIAAFEKGHNMISGTFSGTVQNYQTNNNLVVTNGIFSNIFLEPH